MRIGDLAHHVDDTQTLGRQIRRERRRPGPSPPGRHPCGTCRRGTRRRARGREGRGPAAWASAAYPVSYAAVHEAIVRLERDRRGVATCVSHTEPLRDRLQSEVREAIVLDLSCGRYQSKARTLSSIGVELPGSARSTDRSNDVEPLRRRVGATRHRSGREPANSGWLPTLKVTTTRSRRPAPDSHLPRIASTRRRGRRCRRDCRRRRRRHPGETQRGLVARATEGVGYEPNVRRVGGFVRRTQSRDTDTSTPVRSTPANPHGRVPAALVGRLRRGSLAQLLGAVAAVAVPPVAAVPVQAQHRRVVLQSVTGRLEDAVGQGADRLPGVQVPVAAMAPGGRRRPRCARACRRSRGRAGRRAPGRPRVARRWCRPNRPKREVPAGPAAS